MNLFVYAALIGIPATLACMVLARMWTTSESKMNIIALGLAFFVLTAVAYLMLPGSITPDRDLSNGILLYLWFVQSFCFWLVSSVSLVFLEAPADRIAVRLQRKDEDASKDVFE
uniref:hypothetical protein n=1 Tax=uncultured Altererythrobacter sp. TaxID=500840 RepID=UPI0026266EA1|nr:hypothetical protein [uncultured Altererythrobacter sp.]